MRTEICDFCGKEIPNEPRLVLKDPQIMKKDSSDIVLCADCLNNYTSGDYDKTIGNMALSGGAIGVKKITNPLKTLIAASFILVVVTILIVIKRIRFQIKIISR